VTQRSRYPRTARFWPVLLLLPMAVGLLDLERCGAPLSAPAKRAQRDEGTSAPESPKATAPQPHGGSRPRARPPAAPVSQATHAPCTPNARKSCHAGDVWWFDGCGMPEAVVEVCDGRPCLGVGCAPARVQTDDTCDGAPAYGRCTGDVARACVAGQLVTVDCAADGRRCVMTGEGARCLARTALDCSPEDAPACDGDSLQRCVDGRWESVDCSQRLGRCDTSFGRARCVGAQSLAAPTLATERCNGVDDDGDGRIDEGVACDDVPLVAFVAGGRIPSDFDAVLQRELWVLNRVFEPLVFRWTETVAHDSPPVFDTTRFDDLAAKLSRFEVRAEPAGRDPRLGEEAGGLDSSRSFFIPVLFVETIATDPPAAGQSTLPNSTCGGVRISDRPARPDGMVVVAARRQPETLAHEIGHYLGLCHTHDELGALGLAAGLTGDCNVTGDGICDTPWDPGPERCAIREDCASVCEDPAAQPDTSNVMSYYMPCRRGLSAEQLAVIEHGLRLRRGWSRCLAPELCPCSIGLPGACPLDMSCQPVGDGATGACVLDGPAMPGAPCSDLSACSRGSICLGASDGARRATRCMRACPAAGGECACVDVGLPFQVCREDLP
jgi:hypothetical protein